MADSKLYVIEIKANGKPALKLMKDINKEGEKFTDVQGDVQKSQKKTSKGAKDVVRQQKGVAGATNNSTHAFAKMAQQMGGIVPIYAQVAANVFAITAAFGAMERAADFQILMDSADTLAVQTGRSLSILGEEMKDITGSAISMKEAMTQASIAASAGFDNSTIKELTQVARNASVALGREMTDSLNRVFKGAIKAEPELLDELGIILRLETAANKYATVLGKTAKELTTFEKQQAVVNDVLEQGQKKFGRLAEVDPNPFTQLSAAFMDITTEMLNIVNTPIGGFIAFFTENTYSLIAAIVLLASSIAKQALPAITSLGASFITSFENVSKTFSTASVSAKALSDRVNTTRASVDSLVKSAIKHANISEKSKAFAKVMDTNATSVQRVDTALRSVRAQIGAVTRAAGKAGVISPAMIAQRDALRQTADGLVKVRSEIVNTTKATKVANVAVRGFAGALSLTANAASIAALSISGFATSTGIAAANVAAATGLVDKYESAVLSLWEAGTGKNLLIKAFSKVGSVLGSLGAGLFSLVPIIAGVTIAWQVLSGAFAFAKRIFGFEDIAKLSEKLNEQKEALDKSAGAVSNYVENLKDLPDTLENISDRLTIQANVLGGLAEEMKKVNDAVAQDEGFGAWDWLLDLVNAGQLDTFKENMEGVIEQLDKLGYASAVSQEARDLADKFVGGGEAAEIYGIKLQTLLTDLQRYAQGAKEANQAIIDGVETLNKATSKLSGELPSLGGVEQVLLEVTNLASGLDAKKMETVADAISRMSSLTIGTLGIEDLSEEVNEYLNLLRIAEENTAILEKTRDSLTTPSAKITSVPLIEEQLLAIERQSEEAGDALVEKLGKPLADAIIKFKELEGAARALKEELSNISLDKLIATNTGTDVIRLVEEETAVKLKAIDIETKAAINSRKIIEAADDKLYSERAEKQRQLGAETTSAVDAIRLTSELGNIEARLATNRIDDKKLQLKLDKDSGKAVKELTKLYKETSKEINKITKLQAMGAQGLDDKYNALNDTLEESVSALVRLSGKSREWGDSILYAQKAAEETQKFLTTSRIDPTDAINQQAYAIDTNIGKLEMALSVSNAMNNTLFTRADAEWQITDALLAQQLILAQAKEAASAAAVASATTSEEDYVASQTHEADMQRVSALQRLRQAGSDQNIAALALSADKQASAMQFELGFLQQKARLGSLFNKADADALKIAKLRAKLKGNTPEDIKRLVNLQKQLNKETRKFEFAKELQEAAESMNDLADGMKKVFNAMRNDDSFDDLGASLVLLRDIGADIDNPLGKFTEGLATAGLAAENYSQQMAGIQKEREQAYQDGTLDRLKAENLELAETQANYGLIANAAGGLAAAFDEGSAAAKTFTLIQQGAAVAAAVAAVANQGSGDPYTAFARIAAMVATMSALLGSIGMAIGGGGDTGAGAAKAYDDRMGSDALRDRDLQSNSMVDSLDELVAIDTQLFGATRDLQITMKNLGETFEKIGALIFSSITGVSGSNYGLDSEYTTQNNSSIVDAVKDITDIFSFMGGDVTADILGSILGSTKVTTETLDQGLNLSAIITNTEDGIKAVFGTIEAETVALVKSESSSFGGLISSSSAGVQSFFSELPEDIVDAMGTGLDQTLNVINDLISGLGDAIGGIDLGLIFSNLSTDVFGEEFISLFELSGEEAGEAIGLYFSALSSDILGDVLPWLQEYSKAGEELTDTMLRITGDTIKLSNSLATVGLGLQDIIGNLATDQSMFEIDPMAFIAQSIVDTSNALGIAQANLAAEKASYETYGERAPDGGTQLAMAYTNPELIDSLATEIAELQGKLITTSIDLIFRNTAKYENDINNAAAQAAEAFKLEVVAAWEEQLLTHFKDIEEFQELFARFSNAIFSETELFNQSVTNATVNITAGFTELLNSVDDFTAADLAATLEENGGDYGAALRTYYEQLISDNTFNADILSGEEIGTAGADLFATVVKTGAAIDMLNEILETAADAIEDLNDQYIQQIALFGLLGKELDLLELAFDYSDAIQEAEETGSSLEAVEMLYGLKRLDIVKTAYEEINATIEDAMSSLTASIVDVSKNLDVWDDVAYSTIKINKLVDQLKKGTTSVNLDSLLGSTDEFGEFIDAFTGIIDDLSTDAPTSVTEEIALVENLREEIINKYELETALIQEQSELFKNLSQEINNFLDSLIIGDLSPLTNLERLDEAQAQFLENAANVFSDDVAVAENAAGNLLGSATELLDQASAFYAITGEYNKLFDLVFNTLEGIDSNLLSELADPADPLIALTETTIEKLGVLDDILVELKAANDQVYLDDISMAVTEGMLPLIGNVTDKLTEIDEGSWTVMIDHLATISNASTATLIAINAGSLSATVNDQTGSILTEIGTPEVAVGTAYVPEDMLATIHQGEAIIPETMAQGMREGTLTMGVTQDNTEVVAAIRELTQVMAQSQEDIVEATHENIQVSRDIANNMVRSSTPKTRRMA